MVPLPPRKESEVIITLINRLLDNEKESMEHCHEIGVTITQITQSILTKAFRGELGTNDPEEENALELLKEVLLEQTGETTDVLKGEGKIQGTLTLV